MPNRRPAAAVAGLDARVAATVEQLLVTPPPGSYRGYWKQFQSFVDNTPELTSNPVYLSRVNVDAFFMVDVANRRVCANTIGKILPALKWYARYREHVHGDFDVASEQTRAALLAQKELGKRTGGSGKEGQDPHYGLKDNMKISDRLKIMDYIYRSRNPWGHEAFSFTWGNNAGVRGASQLKLVLSDLRTSYGYGAEVDGKLSPSLIVVLRKGPVHKDRHDRDDQVAVWRHKEYKLCAVFSTAAHVLSMLKTDELMYFKHDNKDKRAIWWDKKIVNWNNVKGM